MSIHKIYDNSYTENEDWMNRINVVSQASDLIVGAVGPGNAVFENNKLNKEISAHFKITSELSKVIQKISDDAESNPAIYGNVMSNILAIKSNIKAGNDNTKSLFQYFGNGNLNEAAKYMSKMDARYFAALDEMSTVSSHLRKMQRKSLSEDHKRATQLFNNEYIIVGLVLIAVILMIFYGRKLKFQMEESDRVLRERTKELEIFQRGLDTHAIVAKTDRAGTITYVNDTFCNVTGYKKEELIGQNHRILNSGHHPKEFFVDLWKTIAGGKRWKGRIKNKKKDGSFYWVDGTITPMLDEQGKNEGYLSIRTEVTELMELQDFSKEVQKIAKLGGWELDLISKRLVWSDEIYHMHELELGSPIDSVIANDFYLEEYRYIIRKNVASSIESGQGFSGDYQIRTKTGKIKWVRTVAKVTKNDEGQAIKLYGTLQDISERKNQELDLIKLKDEALAGKIRAEMAESAKSVFLANMSHEIRTPLNGVMGMVEILKESDMTPSQREMLQVVDNCGNDLLIILNDILDYSKIESGKLEVEKESFSVNECIREVASLFSGSAALRNNYIVVDVPKDINPFVLGDKARVKQILSNYMSNAIKFTKNKFVEIGYKIIDEPNDSKTVQFFVQDNGVGIPVSVQTQLFQAFVQGDQSITKEYGGTGLGLSINAKLAELMKGEVSFESKVGKGSTFYFDLKLKADEYSASPVKQRNESDNQPSNFIGEVLIVEDNVINQRIVSRYVASLGAEYDIASNGQEALEILHKEGIRKYSLILMDLQMPVMDGLTATSKIIETYGDNHPPIIALTANAFREDRDRCFDAGMVGYVTKPVKKADLYKVFKEYLKVSRETKIA